MTTIEVAAPYLVFLGAVKNPLDAKTGRGLVDWRRDRCLAQLRLPGCAVDLGLPDLSPAAAVAAGARTLVVGVAPLGGGLDPAWVATFEEALAAGLDLASGMHGKLADHPALAHAARTHGRRLIDVRVPPPGIPVASGRRRAGRRLLTVGTDCCVGKKYTALALARELATRGVACTFRATGQTGILIAGGGIPIDAVVSDFVAGAAEALSPDAPAGPPGHREHWDVIEGQGSLFHPAYAGVTLGLVHGTQPDLMVLCHEAGRTTIDEYPDFPIPSLLECLDRYRQAARLTNPDAGWLGVSLNTSSLDVDSAAGAVAEARDATGLPCVDPMRDGVAPLVDALAARFPVNAPAS
jgi:D-glutamate N-acetyltransferase